MRTSIINQLTRGIFFLFLVLILTACTGKEDIVFEFDGYGSGMENIPEPERDSVVKTGTETIPSDGGNRGTGAGETSETEPEGRDGKSGAEAAAESVQETVSSDIYVHICGAVENPGVYILAAGSRVYEGVAAAGGFRKDACEDFINQAGVLQDGQRLVIPTEEEAEAAKADGSYQSLWQEDVSSTGVQMPGTADAADDSFGNTGGLVNINTATESELSAIPGIGAGKAAAIVQYRQENGRFASIEDIMKVSGIKEGTFEKIKDKITIN